MQFVPGVNVKDSGFGWKGFTQVSIMVKEAELPVFLKENINECSLCCRASAQTLNIPVRTTDSIKCSLIKFMEVHRRMHQARAVRLIMRKVRDARGQSKRITGQAESCRNSYRE